MILLISYFRRSNMALIKCPECNKEISNNSKICVHCGYPIKNKNMDCMINGVSYDLSFLLDDSISVPLKGKQLHLLTKCNLKDCLNKTKIIVEAGEIPKVLNLKQQEIVEEKNIIRCPTCSSTKVKRISVTAKVAGAVIVGLFSKTAKSQFMCENCGYKW